MFASIACKDLQANQSTMLSDRDFLWNLLFFLIKTISQFEFYVKVEWNKDSQMKK